MGEALNPEFRSNLILDLHYYRNIVEEEEEVEKPAAEVDKDVDDADADEDDVMEDEDGDNDGKVKKKKKLKKVVPKKVVKPPPPAPAAASSSSAGKPGLNDKAKEILAFLSQVDVENENAEEMKKEQDLLDALDIPRIPQNKFRFCPWCSNILQVHHSGGKKATDSWRWKCHTCPYNLPVIRQHRYVTFVETNAEDEEDQIVEMAKANEHRQRTEILCPTCDHREAYFYQMQTRSADEPMTTFYECCNRTCGHHWRD